MRIPNISTMRGCLAIQLIAAGMSCAMALSAGGAQQDGVHGANSNGSKASGRPQAAGRARQGNPMGDRGPNYQNVQQVGLRPIFDGKSMNGWDGDPDFGEQKTAV